MEKQNTQNSDRLAVVDEILARDKKRDRQNVLKVIIFNVVNLLVVVVIFYLLRMLPAVASDIKDVRSQSYAAQGNSDVGILQSEIDRNADKITELQNLYLNDSGFVDFVSTLDAMKNEGVVAEYSFTGVNSNTRNNQTGVPFSITFQGQADQINSALSRVQSLPVLLAPSEAELTIQETMLFRYSAFLITSDDISNN